MNKLIVKQRITLIMIIPRIFSMIEYHEICIYGAANNTFKHNCFSL